MAEFEHPEHKEQTSLYKRITDDLKNLNHNVCEVNSQLTQAKSTNENTVLVTQLCEGYKKGAEFHLQKTGKLQKPLEE